MRYYAARRHLYSLITASPRWKLWSFTGNVGRVPEQEEESSREGRLFHLNSEEIMIWKNKQTNKTYIQEPFLWSLLLIKKINFRLWMRQLENTVLASFSFKCWWWDIVSGEVYTYWGRKSNMQAERRKCNLIRRIRFSTYPQVTEGVWMRVPAWCGSCMRSGRPSLPTSLRLHRRHNMTGEDIWYFETLAA